VSADFVAELANVFNTDQRFTVPPIAPVRLSSSSFPDDFLTRTRPPRQLQPGLPRRF